MGVVKIMVVDVGLYKIVVNSCLEALEGRMTLKRLDEVGFTGGKNRGSNKWR